MRRYIRPVMPMLLTGIVIAGCGGDDKGGAGGAASQPRTVTTTAQKAPAAVPGSIEEAEQRLTAAGYTVSEDTVSPPASAFREVAGVLIYEYPSPDEAQTGYEDIRGVVRDHPDRGVAIVEGRRVYFLGKERTLTSKQREAFGTIVNVAEGR